MNEREFSDDVVGDGGVGRANDAEMCPCAIERAVSVEKKLTCRGMGYIFRMINV